jgi:hypothetical protein
MGGVLGCVLAKGVDEDVDVTQDRRRTP